MSNDNPMAVIGQVFAEALTMKPTTFTAPCGGPSWQFGVDLDAGPLIQVVNRRLSIVSLAPVRDVSISRLELAIALVTARTRIRIHAKREDRTQ